MVKLKKWNDLIRPSHLKTRNQAIIELREGKSVDLTEDEIKELEQEGAVLEVDKPKKAKKPKKDKVKK